MRLVVNGKTETFPEGSKVTDLLAHYALAPVRVAVEVNHDLVPRADFGETPLAEGDSVEIVTFVGGG